MAAHTTIFYYQCSFTCTQIFIPNWGLLIKNLERDVAMVTLKDQVVMLMLRMIFRVIKKAYVFFTLFSSILSDLSLVVSYFIRKLVYHFLTRPKMTWSEENDDIMLCREILLEEPYTFKHGSREKGRCWDRIAEALNKIDKPKFIVDQRVVRDRFVKLEKACKKKTRDELRARGIAPNEPSELDQALEEIIEKSKVQNNKRRLVVQKNSKR